MGNSHGVRGGGTLSWPHCHEGWIRRAFPEGEGHREAFLEGEGHREASLEGVGHREEF